MKLKIGFIGFGKSTNRYHLPYVLQRDSLEVSKIYSKTRKPDVEEQYKSCGIEFTSEIDDILQDPDIQLVSICTSHASHYEFARRSLEHNKHVLVEKPFVTTLAEAKDLINLAKEKNLVIMPFQNRRFDSDFLALKQVLSSGRIGNIVEIESHFDYFRTEYPDNHGKKMDGAFYGLGVHTIDQIISLFGRPDKVYTDIRSVRNPNNPDDYYHVELFYQHFKAIVKTNHLVKIPYPKFTLLGTKGSFVKYGIDRQEECLKAGMTPDQSGFGLDPEESYGKVQFEDSDGSHFEKIITPKGDYGRVYDNLYQAVMNGKKKLVSDEEILTVMEILEEGIQGENPKIYTLN
ncbi:putative dehydrogenase [Peribacillus deserti]|uniref:Dehydrogenase n=1 Tax=Peribacillus deserti TaxID=673318 RepID=A0ABS2QGA0_9BACI|nr:oxidoreductase [Peribacillus deserti]MBM7692055.1 putative dehydrogenase [Peribacillus deserti]